MHLLRVVLSWIFGVVTLSIPVALIFRRVSRKRITKGSNTNQYQKGGDGSLNLQAGNDIHIDGKGMQE